MRPTFIIVGTCAAGCSQLTAALRQHPEIFLPRNHRPEPHYFYKSWEYEKPLSYYESRYFSDVQGEKAIGETSGSYLLGADFVAPRIHQAYPDIKIVMSLRNPVERTYGGYRATAFHGLEDLEFDEALRQEAHRVAAETGQWAEIQPRNYTGRSFYGRQLAKFREYFAPEQFFILKSEETRKNPVAAFQRAYAFLGVDSNFVPTVPPTYTSRSVINLKLQRQLREYFQDRTDAITDLIEKERDPTQLAKDGTDREMILRFVNNLRPQVPPMSDFARSYLRQLFAPDVERLAPLVPFTVDDWL